MGECNLVNHLLKLQQKAVLLDGAKKQLLIQSSRHRVLDLGPTLDFLLVATFIFSTLDTRTHTQLHAVQNPEECTQKKAIQVNSSFP